MKYIHTVCSTLISYRRFQLIPSYELICGKDMEYASEKEIHTHAHAHSCCSVPKSFHSQPSCLEGEGKKVKHKKPEYRSISCQCDVSPRGSASLEMKSERGSLIGAKASWCSALRVEWDAASLQPGYLIEAYCYFICTRSDTCFRGRNGEISLLSKHTNTFSLAIANCTAPKHTSRC